VEDLGQQLRDRGWRQGVILPLSSFPIDTVADCSCPEGALLVAVSQSCDLVHGILENEPYANFLVLRPVDSPEKGLQHGRHPRKIHLQTEKGIFVEAQAWNQIKVGRKILLDMDVQGADKISDRELRVLTDWLAKRFTRIAFPDRFNNLLRTKDKQVKKLLSKNHELFLEVLLYLSPFEEIPSTNQYQLIGRLLMPAELWEDEKSLRAAEDIAEKLKKLIEACRIEVIDFAPISEEELSYAELRQLARWDYDYFSSKDSE
jgi:hypothetical protein